MSLNPKLSGAVGLAIRAGKCSQGTEAAEKAVRMKKAALVLLDPAASENLQKSVRDMCQYHHCPWIMLPQAGMLEDISGTANRKVIAVNDHGFAQLILKYTE
jgi:ribosomal protein L7Ae-like RNA K-turn-binding protein